MRPSRLARTDGTQSELVYDPRARRRLPQALTQHDLPAASGAPLSIDVVVNRAIFEELIKRGPLERSRAMVRWNLPAHPYSRRQYRGQRYETRSRHRSDYLRWIFGKSDSRMGIKHSARHLLTKHHIWCIPTLVRHLSLRCPPEVAIPIPWPCPPRNTHSYWRFFI